MDLWKWSRKKTAIINAIIITVTSIPCVLGFNVWSGFMPFGKNTNVMDLEDFLISNLILPIGSLIYTLFCTNRYGWGWDNYIKEVNSGSGLKVPKQIRFYCKWILPITIIFIIVNGLISKFF